MKKAPKQAHTSNNKFGMGDFYGSGVRQKIGRIRETFGPNVPHLTPKELKKPPKSLA